ncbi:MAG: efflux RND transporter periplasmic adaptor subunit [Oligoflexia bacterium]|nr:efflux RND transporter periplasmic adaptor subunit [Oligoflexia bacterium]
MFKWWIILIAVLGTATFFSCTTKENTGENASEHSHQQVGQKEVWTCSMHPQIRKDGPGKCPICGMDLVKVDAENLTTDQSQAHIPEGHAMFQLSNNRIQMIGVKYGLVEKKSLFKSVEAAGRVAFDPELYTAQNEYVEAIRQLERVKDAPIADVKHSAQRMVESAKLRLKILGLSDAQIAKLRSAGPSTGSNLLITSPGENVWIYAEVFEMDLSSVEPGQEVKISGGSLEGKELIGKVASVDRVINPITRTAKVRVLVPNAKAFLRPEAFVNTTILSPLGEQVVVPFDAVLDSGKEAWVFVVKDDGHFEPRAVVIKHYAGEEVAISQGLKPSEKIVTSANFLIDSESRLKGVLSSQAAAETGENKDPAPKTPECPKGQEWHEQMKHCMAKVGG